MNTHDDLDDFEAKIKEKINFQNILNKNFKKQENTPVSDLIKSTTQMVVEDEYLAPKAKTSQLENKIDRLESLLHSIIINQTNLQLSIPLQTENKLSTKFNEKKIYMTTGIIIFAFLAYYIGASNSHFAPSPTQSVEQNLTQPVQEGKIESSVITLKFANLRLSPSTKAQIQTVIQPNSKLRVLENQKDWIKVEYKDYIKNLTVTGWMYSDNIKKL